MPLQTRSKDTRWGEYHLVYTVVISGDLAMNQPLDKSAEAYDGWYERSRDAGDDMRLGQGRADEGTSSRLAGERRRATGMRPRSD